MNRPTSLAVRTTAVCLAVAGVMALVAAIVAVRLVATTSRDLTRQTLADQADVVATQLARSRLGALRITQTLRGQGVEVARRGATGAVTGTDRVAVLAARQAGIERATPRRPVSASTVVGWETLLVEGRAVDAQTSIALVRRVETAQGIGRRLVGNVVFALGVGLLVAAAAGWLLARRLSRPLRRTAAVAAAMRSGRRDLRVPPEGPLELVAVGESINELADALEHSEARQREFLLSVSHELRTPLTAVSGFAESLADGVVAGDEVPEVGRVIGREAARLDRLVSDLLDLARLGADDFRLDLAEVDLTALAAESAAVWRTRCAAAGVEFSADTPAHPVPVRTDPRRVRQVVDGLAENALRVTPPGAPLVLALRVERGTAVLEVRDGGPGLSEQDYRSAFERGVLHARYSATRPGGTGIGLALVHGLVTRLGGTIEAGPAEEGGARFTVRLPGAG
ncbi:HAMP domain-containing sensor histidine kinase [Actinophytocola xanthii]|uniref:histidine kinase n=1 Tax=Actinophytocola xanthii TaxID=1912961 RepID=A0A1Q8CVE4_9PSEU|nr:HAMP domain-containing sensor histidine kinase [Actinophytocola xanthii]OLF18335.1 two-component sensor histidine kinase [Actinophytocola xanthii]